MRYLSTVLILAAMAGFLLGFSAYLRASSQMLEDARLASATHVKKKSRRHRHPAPVQAGPSEGLPSGAWEVPEQ